MPTGSWAGRRGRTTGWCRWRRRRGASAPTCGRRPPEPGELAEPQGPPGRRVGGPRPRTTSDVLRPARGRRVRRLIPPRLPVPPPQAHPSRRVGFRVQPSPLAHPHAAPRPTRVPPADAPRRPPRHQLRTLRTGPRAAFPPIAPPPALRSQMQPPGRRPSSPTLGRASPMRQRIWRQSFAATAGLVVLSGRGVRPNPGPPERRLHDGLTPGQAAPVYQTAQPPLSGVQRVEGIVRQSHGRPGHHGAGRPAPSTREGFVILPAPPPTAHRGRDRGGERRTRSRSTGGTPTRTRRSTGRRRG